MTDGTLSGSAGNFSPSPALSAEVIDLLGRYESLLRARDLRARATHNRFARIRSDLPDSELIALKAHLSPFVDSVEEFMALPGFSRERQQELPLLKHFLKRSGLTPTGELEKYVDENDVIEVYDQKAIQCYRSFNFFEICSYSLEEIFTYPWWNLYERNPFVTRRIANICMDIFSGRTSTATAVDVPDHVAKEIWSPQKSTLRIRQKWIVPLRDGTGAASHCLANFSIIERF